VSEMDSDLTVRATALTTRQRELLMLLLKSGEPLKSADIAQRLGLSARQLAYDLKSLQRSTTNAATLHISAKGAVELNCAPELRGKYVAALEAASGINLILSGDQRLQLLTLALLTATTPVKLSQLQDRLLVSRSTVIHDLDISEHWLSAQGLRLLRRPNFGVQCTGEESAIRQAITRLVWQGVSEGATLLHVDHFEGLKLNVSGDRSQLPILNDAIALARLWDTRSSLTLVTEAEAQLGGRFSDDAVVFLALSFAIQAQRVQAGCVAEIDEATLSWLRTLDAWPVAVETSKRLAWRWPANWPVGEIAWVCMHLLAAPRNDGWPSDTEDGRNYAVLVDALMQQIAFVYNAPRIARDQVLRDGVENYVVPACLRKRFGLPMSSLLETVPLSSDYAVELEAVKSLVDLVEAQTGVRLPEKESDVMALLMRAAYIRECEDVVQEVIVVCPSGMATAQLLVARLKVYFPRFRSYRVVPLRELNRRTFDANQLIICTVSLPEEIRMRARVIQVHPLLLPADVDRITRMLA
jgi:mannitol operon transcriptional antiterminator